MTRYFDPTSVRRCRVGDNELTPSLTRSTNTSYGGHMATNPELGVCTFDDETARSLMVQAGPPNHGPSGGAAVPCIRSLQKVKSVLELFLQNLATALGAPEF